MSDLINQYSFKLIYSLLLTVIIFGGFILSKFYLIRQIKNKKIRSQYISRLKYLFVIVFMIFFISIWWDASVQILKYLSFIAAAFTLTQKDNLMNMVGSLIINWRGLFSEDDFIRISNFQGRVKSTGLLYFTLIEGNPDFPKSVSGKIIKLPNGLVSRNPVMNLSQEKFSESSLTLIFKPKASLDAIEVLFLVLKQEIYQYLELKEPNFKYYDENHEPKYLIKIRQEKPAGYEMTFLFYCKNIDKNEILYKINKKIIDFTSNHNELVLAFD